MRDIEKIQRALHDWAGKNGPAPTVLATIVSVNEVDEVCIGEDEHRLQFEIRLKPTIGTGEAVTLFPELGSKVLAVRIEDSEDWAVLAIDAADKIRMVAGDTTIEVKNGVLISRAGDGLREILFDLITEIQAIYAPKNVAGIEAIRLRVTQLLKAV